MTVVSNSSPLISLARIGKLELLAALFGEIAIPPEVHREVTVTGQALPGASEIKRADWIRVTPLPLAPDADLVGRCEGLGGGEAAAIYLGRALNADLVLLDERRARRVAAEVPLPIAGCLAVLETAFRRKRGHRSTWMLHRIASARNSI